MLPPGQELLIINTDIITAEGAITAADIMGMPTPARRRTDTIPAGEVITPAAVTAVIVVAGTLVGATVAAAATEAGSGAARLFGAPC